MDNAPSGGAAGASGIVVTTDRSVNCASLTTIAADLTRGCPTDREKAAAVYDFMVRTVYMPDHPWRPVERIAGRLRFPEDPMKYITVYGCCGCGPQARVFGSLLRAAGLECRLLNPGFGHVSNEVLWDGRWHWMDVWLPAYVTDRAGDVYSYSELMADRRLFATARDEGRVPGNFMVDYEQNRDVVLNAGRHRARTRAGYPQRYQEDLRLRPGESCTWLWGNVGKHYWPSGRHGQTCASGPAVRFGDDRALRDAFPFWEPYGKRIDDGPRGRGATYYRYYGNAISACTPPLTPRGLQDMGGRTEGLTFVPDGGIEPEPASGHPYDASLGTVELAFDVPYVIADAEVSGQAHVVPGGAVSCHYSVDGGRQWILAGEVRQSGGLGPVGLGRPNTHAYPSGTVTGQYGYRLRVTLLGRRAETATRLTALRVTTTTMLNFYSRPWLEPGANRVKVTAARHSTLSRTPLEVTWRWEESGLPEKSHTHRVERSGQTCTIEVGGAKRPRMKSVTIGCAAP